MSPPPDPTDSTTEGESKSDAAAAVAPSLRAERKPERASVRPGGAVSLVGVTLSGRYLIKKLIGEGGMGAVYEAEHTHMRKRLAVKVLHPEMSRLSEVVARFEREAMAAAHIDHPNVAAATDFGKLEDGSFFLVLEYVEGKSLREALGGSRIDLGRALHITRQIASALGRAHVLGIVHRDLKPENVMLVARDGDPDFAKVLDFGIAKVPVGGLGGESKVPGQVLTQLGMVYGTPEYMAPEQALGQPVDARADIYALGVMLFEMIAGMRPYDHDSKVTLLGMHVTAPIPKMSERAPDAEVPADIDAIVLKMMAKEATHRFADTRELIEALDAAAVQLSASGRIPEYSPPTSIGQAPLTTGLRLGNVRPPANSAMALGPTSLAQPAFRAPSWIAKRLRPTMDRVLAKAPPWVTPRLLALAGAAAAVLAAVFIVVAASAHGGAAPAGSPAANGSSPPEQQHGEDVKNDEIVATAQTKIDKGDFATAIDTLMALEKAGPDRADEHQLLERAFTGVRNTHDAMREAGLWLAADANAAADPKLQEDVRNAALFREGQDDAFTLLESKMGQRGIDILYDIAYGASGRQYPQAATRARKSLDGDDIRGRASPALAVLLDFRDAKTCDAKRALLDRARDHGDARLLAILQPYAPTRGCGFLSRSDCYPCMHRDSTLKDAISAIEERAR